jgi:lipoate-protein ligase A
MTPCRLIVDAAASGAWQMAVDDVLLETAAESHAASLRFYSWSEPTLSLGYFQSIADRAKHPASRDCPLVRRQTGGGAILHDDELTYSLALPYADPLATDAAWLYNAVHEALIGVLADVAIAATLRGVSEPPGTSAEPFLCFQRATPGDVLVGSVKVCGSAQRRRRGAILQHGSLLLGRSARAPELPGIGDLADHRPDVERLRSAWAAAVAGRLNLALTAGPLSEGELAGVRSLALEKYGSNRWNRRR